MTDMKQESKYTYDEESVIKIVEWAKSANLPKEIVLSESEHIFDTKLYISANIYDIRDHYPDPFYNPSIDRLYRLKEFAEKQE